MAQLSLTGKRWLLEEPTHEAEASIADTLLHRRQLEALGAGEILDVIGHDAAQFRDCEKAMERIAQAIGEEETIGIFGDYDCDGITATTLLARFFERRNIRPVLRLPHRLKEGYGLQTAMVDELHARGVTLLLTVDTGVTAVAAVARARECGMDVIVLDHHSLPEGPLPAAYAILHPALAAPPMASPPCGAGVAWSLVSAFEHRDGQDDWKDRATDVALAAIGTVADIVELRGGNRSLVHAGLLALQSLHEGPLAFLCVNAGLQKPFTSRDIGFRIAPRINAAGRMDDPHVALYGLLGDTQALLDLDALNQQRQDVVTAHIAALLPRAAEHTGGMLCFVEDDYSPGICGLLAGRLAEAFGKPSMVGSRVGEICTASLRSIPGYDVTSGLARVSDLLLSFGGHPMAAGCSFRAEVFPALRARLEADSEAHIGTEDRIPTLLAECALSIDQVTTNLCDQLSVLEPFGQGNSEPRFLIENIQLENVRCVGKSAKHLQASAHGRKVIGFSLGHLENELHQPVDLLCRIGMDTWQGRRAVQLFLEDVRVAERAEKPGTRDRVRVAGQK